MANERLLHDLVVDHLRYRLAREYGEITVNPSGTPDLTLASHGLVLALVEVETESTITPEKAAAWKTLAQPGTKLILMVPKHARVKVMELLWQQGVADRVSVGTYDLAITMP
ncbi:MAG: hypothetical protein AB1805_10860 [Nitrospirota bacterium]